MTNTNPTPTSEPPDILDIDELATYLGVSRRTLEGMIADGKAPPHRTLGARTRRWHRAAVDAWLTSGAADGGSAA